MPIVQVHGTDALCNDIADLGPGTRSSIVLSSGSGSAGRMDDVSFGGLDGFGSLDDISISRQSYHHASTPDDERSQPHRTRHNSHQPMTGTPIIPDDERSHSHRPRHNSHQPMTGTPIFIVDVPTALDDSSPPPPPPRAPGRRRRHTMDHLNNNLDDDDMTVDTALMQPTAQNALLDIDERSAVKPSLGTGLGTISTLASQFQTLHKSKQDYSHEIQTLQSKLDDLQNTHRQTLDDNALLRREISDLKQQAEIDAMKINVILRERDELRTEVECLERDLERCKNRRAVPGELNKKRSFMTRMLSVQAGHNQKLDDVEEEEDEYNVPIITQNKFCLRSVVKFDTVAIDRGERKNSFRNVKELEKGKQEVDPVTPVVTEGRLGLRGFFNFGAGEQKSDSTCSSTTEGDGVGSEEKKPEGKDRRMSRMMTVKFDLDEGNDSDDSDENSDEEEKNKEQPVPEETTAGAPMIGLWGMGQRLRFQQPQPPPQSQPQPQPQPQQDKSADPADDNESEILQKPSNDDPSDVAPPRGIVGSLFRRQQQQQQPETDDNESVVSSKVSTGSSKASTEDSSSDVTPTRGIGLLFKRSSKKSQSVKFETSLDVTPACSDDNVDAATVGSPETSTISETEGPSNTEEENDTEDHNDDSQTVEAIPATNKLGLTSLFRRGQAPPQDNTPQDDPPTKEEAEADVADDTPINQPPTDEPPSTTNNQMTAPIPNNNMFSLRHLLRTPSQIHRPPDTKPEDTNDTPPENDTQLPPRRRQSGGIVQGLFRLRSSQRNTSPNNDNRDELSQDLSHRSSEFLTFKKENREDEGEEPIYIGFPQVRVNRSSEEMEEESPSSPVIEERRPEVEERPSMTSLQASSISGSSRSFLSNEESHKCVPIGFY